MITLIAAFALLAGALLPASVGARPSLPDYRPVSAPSWATDSEIDSLSSTRIDQVRESLGTAEQPATEEPAAEEPATEEPAAEEPAAEEPAA
ncbi:MAG TPA: hypothetical protein VIA02_06580, partial [Candidatus Limnocylindria bacterium]